MRDTIDMAREAGDDWDSTLSTDKEFLKRFEALVRADERALAFVKLEQRVKEAYQDGHTAGAKSEREACAKLIETHVPTTTPTWVSYAAAIRERGNK